MPGTYIVGAILLAVVISISYRLIKDKKQGKSSCGCNCSGCGMSGSCHPKK